jgi:hypothetical protein
VEESKILGRVSALRQSLTGTPVKDAETVRIVFSFAPKRANLNYASFNAQLHQTTKLTN